MFDPGGEPEIPKRPQPYRGALTAEQLAAGMTAVSQNAGRLLADAELLANAQRHPSAVSLAILAIEEAAKEDILAALATWPEERNVFWRAFRWHVDKNSLGFVPLLHDRNYSAINSLIWLHEHSDDRYFDEMKWSGLYVDLLSGDAGPFWWQPDGLNEEHSRFFIEVARRVVRPRTVSTAEVDLLQRYVRPQKQTTFAERDAGMKAYIQGRGARPSRVRAVDGPAWRKARVGRVTVADDMGDLNDSDPTTRLRAAGRYRSTPAAPSYWGDPWPDELAAQVVRWPLHLIGSANAWLVYVAPNPGPYDPSEKRKPYSSRSSRHSEGARIHMSRNIRFEAGTCYESSSLQASAAFSPKMKR